LALLGVSLNLGFMGEVNALTPEQEQRLQKEIRVIIDRQPKYVWGGSESEDRGLDCSGYIYLAARRAGIGVRRTTALNMSRGFAGWNGVDVGLHVARECDIPFWTWGIGKGTSGDRKCGHVGVLIRDRSGSPKVTHASQLRGRVVVEDLRGKLLTDIDVIRRLKGE
jgi:hypothetical protein